MPLVVKSMAYNPDVHWLLITDEPVTDAPPNVSVRLCEFTDLGVVVPAARLPRRAAGSRHRLPRTVEDAADRISS
jgi:hypothetical protein